MLPLVPLIGEFVRAKIFKSKSLARPIIFLITSICTFLSLTMPPLPTLPFPASNCGFISATIFPFSPQISYATGRTNSREIKETSMEIKSTSSVINSLSKYLILVLSRETTLSSILSL